MTDTASTRLADELTSCKVIDRDLDARVAVALYSDTGHADDRDNTRALMPTKFDECAPGTYWISAFSGLSLRTAPGFTGDKILRDLAISALRRQQSGEAVERRPIMLEMAAADDEHRKWERRWHALQRIYAVERNFSDADGRWGLRDFLNYAGQVCGYFPPSVTPKTEASEADVERERGKLTPEYLAMSPLQKWDTLTLHGLLGTDEPWIADMRETLAALQSPPVEQPAQAEAQQPSDGLVEEIERRFGKGVEQRPLDWQTRDRILAALKARTSPETVELLRETRGTMAEQVRRCERWGKSHHEMDAAISAIDALLFNTPGKEGSDG